MDLKVLYEDNHIIVVEKPVNIPSQEDKTGDIDMLTIIKSYIKEKYNKPGEVYLGLVHRLDRPTGGVMVFARTSKAASRLSEQIRDKKFQKKYLAIVDGKMEENSGVMKDFLLKNEKTNMSKVVKEGTKNAKEAVKTALTNATGPIITSAVGMFSATIGVAIYSAINVISTMCNLLARGAILGMTAVLIVLPGLLILFDKVICKTSLDFKNIIQGGKL